tara:strand:- start:593 stop:1006 length:414 start_codon:yes stop_codon:yes gene_type:complete
MPEETPEILNDIDARFAQYEAIIKATQKAYFSDNGRYWQGLWTHSSTPSSESAPDSLSDSPTDQEASWLDMLSAYPGISFPETMLSRMRIDTYEDSSGHGYVVILERDVGSDTWRKMVNMKGSKIVSNEWGKLTGGL